MEGFKEIDHRPTSMVYVEGPDIHPFFDFLLNYPGQLTGSPISLLILLYNQVMFVYYLSLAYLINENISTIPNHTKQYIQSHKTSYIHYILYVTFNICMFFKHITFFLFNHIFLCINASFIFHDLINIKLFIYYYEIFFCGPNSYSD